MDESSEFELLINAARCGDQSALESLVKQYEPELRIVARSRLGAALRPHLDSIDLVQSVHRSLLIGLRDNRFEISSPEKLLGLALTIVRRKIARHWQHLKRQQRLSGNLDSSTSDIVDVIASFQTTQSSVEDEYSRRDLLEQWTQQLDPIEKQLVLMRIEGHSTVEVARSLNLDPDVLRVKLSRLRKRLRDRGLVDEALR